MSNKFHRITIWILGIVSVALLALLAYTFGQLVQLRAELRYANEIMSMFDYHCRVASHGTMSDAADELWRLHFPSFDWKGKPEPFQDSVLRLVEKHRRGAVSVVILCLKEKTKEDLGDDPEPWIRKYATDAIRDQMDAMIAVIADDSTEGSSNSVQRTGINRSVPETNRTSSTTGSHL